MLDAYAVRKAVPRILLAVIGINLSIYLCLAAVDATNVIGRGIAGLLVGPFVQAGAYDFDVEGFSDGNISNTIGLIGGAGIFVASGAAAAMVAGIASLATAPLATLGMLLILMIPIALVALAILITIIIRQALLIFLIIISPVAIACFVLPGTEKYFRQWLEIFTKTLLVYPIIAAIFAMSDVFGSIIFRSAQDGSGLSGPVKLITGIIVIYAPLFLIPFAFRFAGGVMGRLASVATTGAGKLAEMGPIKGRREIAKRDLHNRQIQQRADIAGRMQDRGSRAGNRFTRGLYRRGAGAIGGYNIEEQASAQRAQMAKVLNDQIATGRDEEIRGLTVNKRAADAAYAAGDHSLRREQADGTVQYKSLGGQWINEAHVDAGQKRWGRDTYAQQSALSYEMRKAATQDEVRDISDRYMETATGSGGWGMSRSQAVGAFKGAGFENQNTQLEYKHTNFNAATGVAEVDYASLAKEAYEKKGSYQLAQGGASTLDRLREGHAVAIANGDTVTQQRIEGVAETFMTRYGGGGGQVGMQDDVPIQQPGAPQAGGQGVFQTNTPGAAGVAEAARQFAVDVGVYQELDPNTYSQSNPPPPPNPRQN